LIAALEQAVADVLQIDPRRDGWAVDTVQVTGPLSDEGVPSREARGGMVASFSTTYRTNFHPQDESEIRMAHGELFQTASAPTTLSPGTYVLVAGTTQLGSAKDFDQLSNGRLRYTGIKTRDFIVDVSASMLGNASFDAAFRLRQNGTSVAKSQIRRAVAAAGRQSVAVRAVLTLATNDIVDLAVDAAGTTVTAEDLNLTATQVPKF
jgi:hypothetical protein